jgi:ribosomal protein L11 methyltransferase
VTPSSGPATWLAVTVRGAHDAQAVSDALFAAGVEGVWEQGSALVTHVPASHDIDALRGGVAAAAPEAVVEVATVAAVDWSVAWREHLTAVEAGPFVVAPPWLAGGLPPERAIVIEPAMAFGTGDHPTTRSLLRLLADDVRPGDHVADLGAGSAVLSIAAAKLGAARVWAIEFDPPAIPNAELNVARNGVADRVHVLEGDAGALLPVVAPVRVILANIISSVLVELFPTMRAALVPGGVALISGVLTRERESLRSVLSADGWQVDEELIEGEWWSARIVAASSAS